MKIYISQLNETKVVLPIIEEYDVGIEAVIFASPFILDDKEKYIKEYKDELGNFFDNIEISLHGPYADLIPGSRDKLISQVANYRFEQAYQVAKDLGVKKIVFHNGYAPNTYYEKEWIRNSANFWKDFMKDKDESIAIHIENVLDEDYKWIKVLIDEVNNSNFSACLDIGHINTYSNLSVKEWIDGLGNRIGHFHIHNNDASRDSHLGIINGSIDVLEILNYIDSKLKDISISLEIIDINELKESMKILNNNNFIKKRNKVK